MALFFGRSGSLRRLLRQITVESVELQIPEGAVLGKSDFGFLQRAIRRTATARSPGTLRDQAGFLEP